MFCFSGGSGGRDAEWAPRSEYGHQASAAARARMLEVVEEELEERFAALGPAASRASQDNVHLRRLYKANLPAAEMGHCKELLRKLAAIDHARQMADGEQKQLQVQLKLAEAAHRQAEFAFARAEAIATARGEALMLAQQATREAESQALQFSEWLKQAMQQLGADVTPFKQSPHLTPPGDNTPPGARQSIFSQQQLAAVAASLSQLPHQSQAAPQQQRQERQQAQDGHARESGVREAERRHQQQLLAKQQQQQAEQQQIRESHEQQYQAQEDERQQLLEEQQRRRSRRQSQQSSQGASEEAQQRAAAGRQQGQHPASLRASREERQVTPQEQQQQEPEQQLSGFTVYTNGLQSPEFGAAPAEAEVDSCRPGWVEQQGLEAEGSGVAWRSISSAALSSRSADGSADHQQRQNQLHRQSQGSLAGSQGSPRQHNQQQQHARSSVSSREQLEAAAAGAAAGEEWLQAGNGNKLQQHAQQLSKLVLPGLHASQLDSLVRIGASMQSPNPHPRGPMEVLNQLLPAGWEETLRWDSTINPLQSKDDAERLLTELRAEWQRQGSTTAGGDGGGPRAGSRGGGSRQASQDGAQHAAAGGQQQQARQLQAAGGSGPGSRAGSEYPPLLPLSYQALYAEGKVPGAGTWVSPSFAAMIAHKKGFNLLLEGGEPSPPSHIKAVMGTTEDREFYGPMAAHLNKRGPAPQQQAAAAPPAVAPSSRPAYTSAESIRGPQRQPPSNRSSLSDGVAWEHTQQQTQQSGAPAAARQAAAVNMRAGLQHSGSAASADCPDSGLQQQQQAPPERRQAAFLNHFQPMGMNAQQGAPPVAASQQQHQQYIAAAASQRQEQQHGHPPRHSSIAVSQLGSRPNSHRSSAASSDENLAAAAFSNASLRGSGHPASRQVAAGGPPLPATKRSLDSTRGSVGGAAANNIGASLSAVEAAMAALRETNPHLRAGGNSGHPPRPQQHAGLAAAAHQQQQRYATAASGGAVGGGRAAADRPMHQRQHSRTKSLPDADMAALASDPDNWQLLEHQRRQQQQQAAACGAQDMYQY